MELFFQLEGGYLGIAVFALVITIFVTTRPFVAKGAWKKGISLMMITITGFIGVHYFVTISRMSGVEEAFNTNVKVLCESRMIRKVAQSLTVLKANEWILEDHKFSSPNYNRKFFTARCIVSMPVAIPKKK